MTSPELTFKCELQKDGQLAVRIVSCANLADLDSTGSYNLSDPYVVVKVGEEKKFTKTISDDLNPIFPEETSTFLFEVWHLMDDISRKKARKSRRSPNLKLSLTD